MSTPKTTRQSGIELLRIITMMGVVILHYNDGKAFVYTQSLGGGVNLYLLYFFESICICAVDLFILISGYFLSGTQKRNYLKILELFVELVLMGEIIYFFSVLLGKPFSITTVLLKLLPGNYFLVLYAVLYILSPYINKGFQRFSGADWNKFIITVLLCFSVWPTFVDLLEELLGFELLGLSSIGMWGGQQGFNIANFCLLYCVGAYIRFGSLPGFLSSSKKRGIGIILTIVGIFLWAMAVEDFTLLELRSAWVYHNPLVILLTAQLFLCFKSLKLDNKALNELSKASYTCFLIHGPMLRRMGIEKFSTGSPWVMLIHILITPILCYMVSYFVYKIYTFATAPLFKLFKKNKLWQTHEVTKAL